jgi:hypothetical protein
MLREAVNLASLQYCKPVNSRKSCNFKTFMSKIKKVTPIVTMTLKEVLFNLTSPFQNDRKKLCEYRPWASIQKTTYELLTTIILGVAYHYSN